MFNNLFDNLDIYTEKHKDNRIGELVSKFKNYLNSLINSKNFLEVSQIRILPEQLAKDLNDTESMALVLCMFADDQMFLNKTFIVTCQNCLFRQAEYEELYIVPHLYNDDLGCFQRDCAEKEKIHVDLHFKFSMEVVNQIFDLTIKSTKRIK